MSLIAESAAPAWPALAPTAPVRPRTANRVAHGGLTLVRDPGTQLLSVQLLGQLTVRIDDAAVTAWPSGRGRSLFKYLVTHRDPWPRREQLMDAFWPEAAPAAARNSLNVAVHGLRRALRDLATGPVVVLEDGTYRLGPQLRLWLDVDEFAHHVAGGRRLEAAGVPAAAAAEYERALALYQGDFLADDPYEEWPALTREHLLLDVMKGVLEDFGRLSGPALTAATLLDGAAVDGASAPRPAAARHATLADGRNLFLREGETWTIGHHGAVRPLRDNKGMRYIAYLLRNPGRDVHAIQLLEGADDAAPEAPHPTATERARLSVTRAIRRALFRIAAVQPVLGRHLHTTIRTGTRCSYAPGQPPSAWEVAETD